MQVSGEDGAERGSGERVEGAEYSRHEFHMKVAKTAFTVNYKHTIELILLKYTVQWGYLVVCIAPSGRRLCSSKLGRFLSLSDTKHMHSNMHQCLMMVRYSDSHECTSVKVYGLKKEHMEL